MAIVVVVAKTTMPPRLVRLGEGGDRSAAAPEPRPVRIARREEYRRVILSMVVAVALPAAVVIVAFSITDAFVVIVVVVVVLVVRDDDDVDAIEGRRYQFPRGARCLDIGGRHHDHVERA
jgi:hypothetical protein